VANRMVGKNKLNLGPCMTHQQSINQSVNHLKKLSKEKVYPVIFFFFDCWVQVRVCNALDEQNMDLWVILLDLTSNRATF
jgi:hypothetical protein